MFTTNKHTQEILEILEPSPMPVHPYIAGRQAKRDDEAEKYLAKLGKLRSRRFDIEQRGDPDEYEALADEYLKIGALSNYEALMTKAKALRGEA